MTSSIDEFKRLEPTEYFRQHIAEGRRVDGRLNLQALRNVSLSVGTISSADGSAIVKQGNTIMVCGITLELAPPKASEPDKGFIVPNVELSPLCHAQFKPGPPSEQAQTSSQFIHEVLSNSDLINLKDLCIKEGKLAWVIHVDLVCLNHDGNLLDAATKAMVAALRTVSLPEVTISKDNENEESGEYSIIDLSVDSISVDAEKRTPLKLGSFPVSCTMAVFEQAVLIDPSFEEESLASCCLTVVLDSENGNVCHFRKTGGSPLSREMIQECTVLAKKQIKNIKSMMEKASTAGGGKL